MIISSLHVLPWFSYQDPAIILTSVSFILNSHGLHEVTVVIQDLARTFCFSFQVVSAHVTESVFLDRTP